MAVKRCLNCNEENLSNTRLCIKCGAILKESEDTISNISDTEENIIATKSGNTGCVVVISSIIAFIIGIAIISNCEEGSIAAKIAALFVFGAIGLFIAGFIISNKSSQKITELNDQKEKMIAESFKKDYIAAKNKYNVPNKALVVRYKNGNADIFQYYNYVWINDGRLYFFPTEKIKAYDKDKLKLYTILLDKIEYYATRGEMVHENKITGGGSGGSSIKGAVIGGIIAGEAGAIIGSRKKSDPIKSELITHDNRETFLNFFDTNDIKHSMFFDFSDYNTFNELMPEKSYDIVNTIKTNNILNKVVNESKSSSIPDQIRELAKLKDEGILTEEEFNEKKKALLEKMG